MVYRMVYGLIMCGRGWAMDRSWMDYGWRLAHRMEYEVIMDALWMTYGIEYVWIEY